MLLVISKEHYSYPALSRCMHTLVAPDKLRKETSMRNRHIQKGFGIGPTIMTFFLAVTGAVVSIFCAFISDLTIVAAGFSVMFAAIWMLSKRKPIRKL